MSTTTPEPASTSPAVEQGGAIGHVERWVQKHVAPELAAVKADVEKAVTALPAALKHIESLANEVASLAKVVDPAAGPEVAAVIQRAETIAQEAASAAGALLIKM